MFEGKRCVLCEKDNIRYFIGECEIAKELFKNSGKDEEKRLNRVE